MDYVFKCSQNADNYQLKMPPGKYIVSDLSGRMLMNGTLLQGKCLDVSHLSPGTYFFSIFHREYEAFHGTFIRK